METLTVLQDIVIEEFKLRRERLVPDAKLAELGVDSLAVLEIMFKIEDRFGLKIKDDVPNLVTLNDVVVYIDKLLMRQAASSAGGAGQ